MAKWSVLFVALLSYSTLSLAVNNLNSTSLLKIVSNLTSDGPTYTNETLPPLNITTTGLADDTTPLATSPGTSTKASTTPSALPDTTTTASTTVPTAAPTTVPTPKSTSISPPTTTNVPTSSIVPSEIPVTDTPNTTSVPPLPKPDRRFDGPSFIGGIVLAFGLMAIAFVSWKFYKARTERNYHTL